MTDPSNAPAPEGQQPAAPAETPAAPDYGAPPEVIQQALNLYNGLNNLDTRGQYLQQVVRPDIDGQFLRQMVQPQEQEAPDPWAQFEQPGYEEAPEEYAPEPFDPRQLQPVFDQYGNQIEERIFQRLGQMAAEQQIKDSSASAAQEAGLPRELADMIEVRVRSAAQMQPNRQPADLAREAAQQVAQVIAQHNAMPPANQPPGTAPPAGPTPAMHQKPRTVEEAMEWSRQPGVLNP